MKQTLKEQMIHFARKIKIVLKYPNITSIYKNRFSDSFSQSDLEYCVRAKYELNMGKELDLNNVQTFNEKLGWLKCFYHDDKMTECADKVTAPAYFKKQTGLGDDYIVRNIGVYEKAEDILFEDLPERYVLKLNCGSGKQIIVSDKTKADISKIKAELVTWNDPKINHYYAGFEYGYKNINPKIVCEEFIDFDYKMEFFCFDGDPAYFWTIYNDKTDDVCADFYDAVSLKKLNLKHGYPNSSNSWEAPKEFGQMFEIAQKLSKGFPFVRIDFFKTSNGFKFSEMTFYHWSGMMPFSPSSFDLEFGNKIKLPAKKL